MSKETNSIYLTLLLSIVSVLLHNYMYFLLKKEEGVFFVIALLSLMALVSAVIYSLSKYVTEKKPDDLWKAGFLGILGFLGFIAADCATLGEGYVCLASISGGTNAHVGDCSAYTSKVCCQVTSPVSSWKLPIWKEVSP